MMPRPLTKIGVFVAAVGFWSGCASPTKELTPSSSARAAETPIMNELVHLCVGDTVLISVEMEMDLGWPATISRPIASDGTIVLWGGQQVGVAGLTLNEAASEVRLALITNYYGIVFRKVNVRKVQPRPESQNFVLTFPNLLKPGEQVVAFQFEVRNCDIVAVNKVPYDWLVDTLSEAADANMSGFPNHGASAFQDMAPLQRFVTIHKNMPQHFDITGYIVVTKNFTQEWTNHLTKSDFILEAAAPNEHLQLPEVHRSAVQPRLHPF
jgi:hypothetical protein